MDALVNELATLAWNAIMATFPIGANAGTFHVGHRDGQFTNHTLVLSVLGALEHDGPQEHPADDKIPAMQISMRAGFTDKPEGPPG